MLLHGSCIIFYAPKSSTPLANFFTKWCKTFVSPQQSYYASILQHEWSITCIRHCRRGTGGGILAQQCDSVRSIFFVPTHMICSFTYSQTPLYWLIPFRIRINVSSAPTNGHSCSGAKRSSWVLHVYRNDLVHFYLDRMGFPSS